MAHDGAAYANERVTILLRRSPLKIAMKPEMGRLVWAQ